MNDAASKKDLFNEIATTGKTIGLSYSPDGVIPPWQFGILKSLGSNLEIFETVLSDTQVQSTLTQRRLALISKEWNVRPGDETPASEAAAEFMREQLEAIAWDDINDKMHYGIFHGFSVAELIYKRDGRRIMVDEVKVRKRTRFRFDLEGRLRLLTRTNALHGEIMPPAKFWTFATGGDSHENPYGIGLAHWLYWPVIFKNRGMKFWSIFLDKFAMPTALATHEFGQDKARINALVSALDAISTDAGIAVPKGVEVTLLEAARSGTTDYSTFCEYMDSSISKVVVGQTMTSDDGSSRSQAEVHNEVREDIVKADADLICESWNRGPGRWLTAWNFPGAKPPLVWRDVEPSEDLDAKATRDKTIVDMGFRPTLDYITETYGEGWTERQQSPTRTPEDGDSGLPDDETETSQFAAPRVLPPEDKLKAAIDAFLADDEALNRQSARIIEPVFAMVKRIGAEQTLGRMAELYPSISHARLTEAIARFLFVAETWGRLSAQAETGSDA